MAVEAIGIVASSIQLADFGLKLSKNLYAYFEAVSNADNRIRDLAKDIELTSQVFQEASRLFGDAHVQAVRNNNASATASTVIESCRTIFNDMDRLLEKGRKNKLSWPYKLYRFEILYADLDRKKSTMQLLLLALQLASQSTFRNEPPARDDEMMQKLEELVRKNEACMRRYEAVSARLEPHNTSSTPSEDEDAVPDPPVNFTRFSTLPQVPSDSATTAPNGPSPPEPPIPETVNDDLSQHERRIPPLDLELCIEHVQGVLQQIEELQDREGDGDLSPASRRQLFDAYSRARVALSRVKDGDAISDGPDSSLSAARSLQDGSGLQRSATESSMSVTSPTQGSSAPHSHAKLKKWKGTVKNRAVEELRTIKEWVSRSLNWLRRCLRQWIHLLRRFVRKRRSPLLFQDLTGRKFTFPWESCHTWDGMQNLINNACAYDKLLRESPSAADYLLEGPDYLLEGPDGTVILPQSWESIVRPGWTISMQATGTAGHTTNLAVSAGERKPGIKLKDAVGRKFTFPWHMCYTWKGIELLIKQAFLYVDIIGQHVREGHYDLVGPDGGIILPQVWKATVQPGWTITMHMWPMEELAPRSPAPPPPPPPPLPGLDLSPDLWVPKPAKAKPRRSKQPRNPPPPIGPMPPLPLVVDVGEGPADLSTSTTHEQEEPNEAMSQQEKWSWRWASKKGKGKSASEGPIGTSSSPPRPPSMVIAEEGPGMVEHGVSQDTANTGAVSLSPEDVPSSAEEALRRWTNVFEVVETEV